MQPEKEKTNKLSINPYLQIQIPAEEQFEEFELIAPKPDSGLQTLQIAKKEHPALFELFLDLSQTQFDFLDVDKDLSTTEQNFLFDKGILVRSDNPPQKPLFACQLDDVEKADFEADVSELIVNPEFHFEPFSFNNLVNWIHEKHISPHQPTVWIKDALTNIEIGYWLDQEQAEIVSKFEAGKKPPNSLDTDLIKQLVESEILTSPEELARKKKKWDEDLNLLKNEFETRKYVVVKEIIPPVQMKAMRNFYRQYVNQGFMPLGDAQVKQRFRQHNEPLARHFHINLASLMSQLVGNTVIPSYVYAASYKEGANLKPHTDRPQCEFSISFQVDYQPEPEKHISPWTLHMSSPENSFVDNTTFDWEDFPEILPNGEHRKGVNLASGDGLFYKGCELIHYRYSLPPGHKSTSLFFHYVPKDFEGILH